MQSIIINNGLVFNGENKPPKNCNILVEDGIVKKISSEKIQKENAKIVDATGKWVMPGFVDNHTHYDG